MSDRYVPKRLCMGCRELKEKDALYRIVRTEDGYLLDPGKKVSGRAVYVCKNAECIRKAIKNKGLNRGFRTGTDPKKGRSFLEELIEQNG